MPFGDYITNTASGIHADGDNTSLFIDLGAAVAVNDWVVGVVGWLPGAAPTGVDDDLGNTYVLDNDLVHNATNGRDSQTFRCKVTVAGTPRITAHWAALTFERRLAAAGWVGNAASVFDTSKGNSQDSPGTGTDAATSTTIAPDQTGELLVGAHINVGEIGTGTGTITAGTNYTGRLAVDAIIGLEDRVLSGTGATAATFTISTDHASITHIVAIAPAALTGGGGGSALGGWPYPTGVQQPSKTPMLGGLFSIVKKDRLYVPARGDRLYVPRGGRIQLAA